MPIAPVAPATNTLITGSFIEEASTPHTTRQQAPQ
jgi:hypothetical protein